MLMTIVTLEVLLFGILDNMKEHIKSIINSELKLQKNLASELGFLSRDPEKNKDLITAFKKDVISSKERTLRYEKMLENE